MKKENELCQNDKNLKNYLEKLEFKIVMSEFENELQYFIFDEKIGIPISENQ